MKIQTNSSVAIVLPPPIGDSLIGMVFVNNLVRNGYQPVVFGWVAEQLADWFPYVRVGRPAEHAGKFDTVIELRPTEQGPKLARSGKTLRLADLPAYDSPKHMVDRIVEIASETFELKDVTRSNGLTLPPGVTCRGAANRVVIHPTGSHPEKMWSREKFLTLARSLERLGFQPSFLVAPNEFDAWRDAVTQGYEVNALALGDVAKWIAESSWFIGNDSGLGHLASAIGVPTVTLFMRRGLARSWRPAWGPGEIVLPLNVVPSGKLKERLWKQLLSVRRVMSVFQTLRNSNSTALSR
ncbi:glycosyltransferase family 9 protein [Paraburkholderia tropica]|uniref:glycosyltransferase family 9 protein n=1 Tax=Paraburkholderia tropica TaxID=92647 RepID=UPI002AB64C5C|nr:glycosyltransferase family 9 protein [Paraburkholderia tropica]